MKFWKLTYELKLEFARAVVRHSYSLRCFPKELVTQKIRSCHFEVVPCSGYSQSRDSFGNLLLTGASMDPLDSLMVRVQAEVATENRPEPEKRAYYQLGMYRAATELSFPGEKLEAFYQKFRGSGKAEDAWERAGEWMARLSDEFSYESGSTGVRTHAEQAFSQGCGVCQDYAHILLALCRRDGLTARYVAGAVPGEGESHAWIEVYRDGFWQGFDPTNNKKTDEDYIRFAFGRDAGDCSLSRGIFVGEGNHRQYICVKMEEQRFD